MNWQKLQINLGNVNSNSNVTVNFYSTKKLDIKAIVSSCGCTTPKYIPEENRLEVKYKPGNIPMHLRHEGKYQPTKTITVYYEDGTTDVLSFTVRVIQK